MKKLFLAGFVLFVGNVINASDIKRVVSPEEREVAQALISIPQRAGSPEEFKGFLVLHQEGIVDLSQLRAGSYQINGTTLHIVHKPSQVSPHLDYSGAYAGGYYTVAMGAHDVHAGAELINAMMHKAAQKEARQEKADLQRMKQELQAHCAHQEKLLDSGDLQGWVDSLFSK